MIVAGKPWQILHGDVRRVCKALPRDYFDATLSDPPYGLSFMGRRWDYSVPSAMLWSEVERTLKPGAAGIMFGGSRTFHRTCVAVEDGGLEIRDVLMWLYGSGFPKSYDVAKGIDDALEDVPFENPTTSRSSLLSVDGGSYRGGVGTKQTAKDVPITSAASAEAKAWEGYGTALKPAYEPILLVRRYLDGTVAENALKWGTGGLAIDASRVGTSGGPAARALNNGENGVRQVYGTYGATRTEAIDAGRWPANIILTHSATCEFVGTKPSKEKAVHTQSTGKPVSSNRAMAGPNYGPTVVGATQRPDEEVWRCAEDCPVRIMNEQSGERPGMSSGGKHRSDYPGGMFGGIDSTSTARGDSGGAARFFYTTKADPYQREAGTHTISKKRAQGVGALRDGGRGGSERGNIHPTVKPIDLIRYLATLILPPKRETPRRILVPFSGSGSEIIGCLQAGWDEVVGIEREAEYIEIAKARIANGGVLSGLQDRKLRRRKRA